MRRFSAWSFCLLGSLMLISSIVSVGLARLRTRDAELRIRDERIATLELELRDRDDQLAKSNGWQLPYEIQLGQARQNALETLFITISDLDRLVTEADAAAHTDTLSDTTRLLRDTSEHAFSAGGLFAIVLGRSMPAAAEGFDDVLRDYGSIARTIADRLDAQGDIRDADRDEIRLLQADLRLFNQFTDNTAWVGDPGKLTDPITHLCRLMNLKSPHVTKLVIDSATHDACMKR
jgi:hypothetical protein